jgi:hypothetical protein
VKERGAWQLTFTLDQRIDRVDNQPARRIVVSGILDLLGRSSDDR